MPEKHQAAARKPLRTIRYIVNFGRCGRKIELNSIPNWGTTLWQMISCPSKLNLLRASLIALALSSSYVHGDVQAEQCPSVWEDYVSIVAEKSKSRANSGPILFSDRDGAVYNCLKQDVQPSQFKRLQTIQLSLPYDRESQLGEDPSMWPLNICRVSQVGSGEEAILVVNLPINPEILTRDVCRAMIKNSTLFRD
jgi:hypothetical protein